MREAQWQAERGQLMEQIQRLTEEAAAAVAVAVGGASHEQGPAASCWASALGLESDEEELDDEGGGGQQQRHLQPCQAKKPGQRLPCESEQAVGCRLQADAGVQVCLGPGSKEAQQTAALLEVAREEMQRLRDINQRLLDSRGVGGGGTSALRLKSEGNRLREQGVRDNGL